MPTLYDNCKIIPSPLVTFRKNTNSLGEGKRLGSTYTVSINGTLMAWKGSPWSSGVPGGGGPFNRFWITAGEPPDESVNANGRLGAILRKQEALEGLFARDGKWLEFYPWDGAAPLKCQLRITNDITYEEGLWYDKCDYTIQGETDKFYLSSDPVDETPLHDELVSSADEQWSIQQDEVAKTYKVEHTVSAVGKRTFDAAGAVNLLAWEVARDFVWNRLGLGINTTVSFSPRSGRTIFNQSASSSGVLNFNTLSPRNFARNETIDELAGSYSLTEEWLMAAGSGTDVYSINVQKIAGEQNTTATASIQGTIRGFYTNLSDYDTRILSAQYVWNQLKGVNLYNRVSTYAGITLNSEPTQAVLDYNPVEGTIGYNYTYTNQQFTGDVSDVWELSKKTSTTDYKATITINGTIQGRMYENDTNPDVKFTRAKNYWATLSASNGIYNRILTLNYFPEITDLRSTPIDVNVSMDEANGIVNYTYVFDNRRNVSNTNNNEVEETYDINSSFSRDEGQTIYSIQGQVVGLRTSDSSSQTTKYNNALSYWTATAQPNMYSRVSTALGVTFNSSPSDVEIAYNPSLGSINYTYRFSSKPQPCVTNALSETINISDENIQGNVNIFAEIAIPERILGPILQDMSTTTAKVRSLEYEGVLAPTGSCNWATSYALKPNINSFVSQVRPSASQVFVVQDVENWSWSNGRYSRSVRWVYQ